MLVKVLNSIKLGLNKAKNLILVLVAVSFMFPYQANASVNTAFGDDEKAEILAYQRVMKEKERLEQEEGEKLEQKQKLASTVKLPVEATYAPAASTSSARTVVASAYTSTPDQTWGDPFTSASGKRVYDGLIATNGLPFGTQVKFPDMYGDKVFTVDDRMSSRYGSSHVDIWLDGPRSEALEFGRRTLQMVII